MSTALHHQTRERARWNRPDGSTAVWRGDGWLTVRVGPTGRHRPRGRARTAAIALALLPGGAASWRRLGAGTARMPRKTPVGVTGEATAGQLAGTIAVNGVAVAAGVANGTEAHRLLRVAAYRRRWLVTGRLALDRPPEAAEMLAALLDPGCTLTPAERALALAELGGMGGA